MTFLSLYLCNKDWSESTELIIISSTESNPAPMRAKPASSIFRDRQVLWFKDCVVMLL